MPPAKWCRETGSVLTAKKKSPNFHLSQPQTGQSIAETAGLKTGHLADIKKYQQKIPRSRDFLLQIYWSIKHRTSLPGFTSRNPDATSKKCSLP